MKIFKIEVPEGFEIDEINSTFESIVFKPIVKEITEIIKNDCDILNYLGESDGDVQEYRKLESAQVGESLLNYQLAICLSKVLNQGHVFDWKNTNECKYFIYMNMCDNTLGYDSWYYASNASARLALKDSKTANYAQTEFSHIYKSYLKG